MTKKSSLGLNKILNKFKLIIDDLQLSVDKKKMSSRVHIIFKNQMELKSMNSAVILCGGKGTRLGSLGKKIPKALVSIHNKPIIWYIINILISKGLIILFYLGIQRNYDQKIYKKN